MSASNASVFTETWVKNLPGQTFVGKMGGIRQLFEQRRLRISTSCLLAKGRMVGLKLLPTVVVCLAHRSERCV